MSTPPFELTGNKEGSTTEPHKLIPEKQLLEKLLKPEKIEKFEHKEKPEKAEHKEKPEKAEHKEKPEKSEHKEKPEKAEHKEKPEKLEHKEKIEKIEHKEKHEYIEKQLLMEAPNKDFGAEITTPVDPSDPEQGLAGRLGKLEQTVGELQHFITANLRPDLSKGALKQEPDAGKSGKA